MVLDLETVLDESLPSPRPPREGEAEKFPASPLHKIVCAGWALLDSAYVIECWGVLDWRSCRNEKGVVRRLVETISELDPVVVTMNGRHFDLPVLAARCFVLGVPFPWYYKTKFGARYRYSREETYDVMDHLSDYGASHSASVHVWSVACGWPGKSPGENGQTVAARVAAGDLAGVSDYCLCDVALETAVFLRAELVRGAALSLAEYQRAGRALLNHAEADPRTAALAFGVDRAHFLCEPAEHSRLDDLEAEAEESWRDLPGEAAE
jgi:predicted PolB exonuclease-like 3'-5' exonuclease